MKNHHVLLHVRNLFLCGMTFFAFNSAYSQQGQSQGLWNAYGPTGVTTNRQVLINNELTVTRNTRFNRNSYVDSLLMANNIRAKLIEAGITIADSAELTSVISSIINAAIINGTDISSIKITAQRMNTDTMVTGILGCGSAKFTGTILANNISAGGTTTLNSVVLNDGITITPFIGTGEGLLKYNNTGGLNRLTFTSDSSDVLTGSGTFRNINTLLQRDTGWQWYDTTVLLSTAPVVAIQNNLLVGGRVSIGSLRMSNGSATDTMTTDRRFAIEAAKIFLRADTVAVKNRVGTEKIYSPTGTIAMEADTVQMAKYASAEQVKADSVRAQEIASDRIRTAALEVSGDIAAYNGTVSSNEVRTNTITTNDLTANSTISSPKVVTSRITSPDSVIQFGDSTIFINTTANSISTDKGVSYVVQGGTLILQNQNPTTVPMTWKGNNTVVNPYIGNVGIGTGTVPPTEKLDVKGNIRINEYDILFRSDVPDGNHGIGWYGTSGMNKPFAGVNVDGPVVYGWDGGALGVNQYGTKSVTLRWTGDGNVGINRNTFLFAQLHVQAVSNKTGLYVSTDHGTNYGYGILCSVSGDNTKGLAVENRATGQEVFKVTGNGQIWGTDLWIKPPPLIPDYVFDENYERPTWLQKRNYYKKYHHLMYVDSWPEIEKGGFGLNRNMPGILRNVEEIALEVNDIWEIVLLQKQEIEMLKKKIEQLEKK